MADPFADITRMIAKFNDLRRVILCHPDQANAVRAEVGKLIDVGLIELEVSDHVDPSTLLICRPELLDPPMPLLTEFAVTGHAP